MRVVGISSRLRPCKQKLKTQLMPECGLWVSVYMGVGACRGGGYSMRYIATLSRYFGKIRICTGVGS